jgi:hypothetical protein
MTGPRKNMVGQRIGKWTVEAFAGRRDGRGVWRCKCHCGTVKVIRRSVLLHSVKRSCDRCAKLAKSEYKAAARLLAAGITQAEIARRMGVTRQRANFIAKFLADGKPGRK